MKESSQKKTNIKLKRERSNIKRNMEKKRVVQGKPKSKKGKQRKTYTRARPYEVSMSRMGVPDALRCTLTYADVFTINPGAQAGVYTFRGNSLFDPDYTSTGHQPYYYDQLAQMYSRYRVYSSRIKVSAMNNVGTSPVQITLVPASEVVSLGLGSYPLEYPRAKGAKMMGVSGYQTTVVTHAATTREILGLKNKQVLDEDFSALTGANPVSIWYWMVSAYNVQATNVNVGVQVKIEYECEFYDRITINPSFKSIPPEQIPREQRLAMAIKLTGRDDPVGPVTQVRVVEQPILVAQAPTTLFK